MATPVPAVASLLQHRGVRLIGGGWLFFIAENVVLSGNRDAIIGSIGEVNYTRTYSNYAADSSSNDSLGYLSSDMQWHCILFWLLLKVLIGRSRYAVHLRMCIHRVRVPASRQEARAEAVDYCPALRSLRRRRTAGAGAGWLFTDVSAIAGADHHGRRPG